MTSLRVAIVSPWALDDPRAWSGVVLPMVETLKERCDLIEVCTRDEPDALVDRVACRLLDGRGGRRYLVGHAVASSRRRAAALRRRLDRVRPDAVLAVAASQDVAFLGGGWPVVQVSDTSFRAIADLYPSYANLHPWSRRQADQVSARSAARVGHTLAASSWARDVLVRDDGIDGGRITVAPFGPAISPPDQMPSHPDTGPLRVLSVVSDWHRKGGDRVLAVAEQLRLAGADVDFTVVGDVPVVPDGVRTPGRVSREELGRLYASHDVLLEPARANAAGVTLTDAAWFGLPALATDVGGVRTIVVDGETGVLVRDDADLVPRLVAELRVGRAPWRSRGTRAAARARTSLSWRAWGDAAMAALTAVTHSGAEPERCEP